MIIYHLFIIFRDLVYYIVYYILSICKLVFLSIKLNITLHTGFNI